MDTLNTIIAAVPSTTKGVIIAGDFNLREDDTGFQEVRDLLAAQKIGICSDLNIPTYYSHKGTPSTIDHIFTSFDIMADRYTRTRVDSCVSSDHETLHLSIKANRNKGSPSPKLSFSRKLDNSKASHLLDNISDFSSMDFSRKAQIIDEILTKASVRNTPRPPKRRGWWNSELIDLRKHALKLLRTFKQKGDSLSYKAYSVARAAFHKQCKAAKKSFKDMEFRQTIDILSSRGITGLFSHFKRKGSAVACPINPEKLREASQKLFACFSSPILEFIPSCLDIFNPLVAQVTLEEIFQVSKTMKSKAPSLNGFSPLQIKTLIPDLGPLLRDIFNDSLANASFPLNWLESCLFYIYKKGDKHDPNNYRSISIENPFLKCFMKILQRRLYTFSEDNGLLPMFQFGFRKNHSTVSASYLLYDLAKNQFSMKKRLYACFFDFRKAFDLVDRSLLMVKLQLLGLPSSFCSLLFFLLKNLKLHVRDDSTVSEPFYSLNGVPQGDAISPILFSLFISDLPEYLRHSAPRLNGVPVPYILFADDFVVLAESKKEL